MATDMAGARKSYSSLKAETTLIVYGWLVTYHVVRMVHLHSSI